MKAIAYLRVSTDSQADSGLSLAAQRAKIEAYANLYSYQLVDVLEEAASGNSLRRTALQAGLAALTASRPRADALIVAKLDRLTRSVRDLGALLDSAFRRCALVSVTEQVDTSTASGRMVLHILTSVAQWEHEAISERTAAALAAKRARGERISGQPPVGYRHEGDRVVVDAAEMRMVAALRRYRSWGLSLRWIANRLYEEGYRNRRGGRIHFTQVARILARAPEEGVHA